MDEAVRRRWIPTLSLAVAGAKMFLTSSSAARAFLWLELDRNHRLTDHRFLGAAKAGGGGGGGGGAGAGAAARLARSCSKKQDPRYWAASTVLYRLHGAHKT